MAKSKHPRARSTRRFWRGPVLYFGRERLGEARIRFSCQTGDWDEAIAFRDGELERMGRLALRPAGMPTFAEMAARHLAQ